VFRTSLFSGLAMVLALSACDTAPPYSNAVDLTGRGVGFSDYAQYMRAQEELSRIRHQQAVQAQASGIDQPRFATAAAQEHMSVGQQAVAAVRGPQPQNTPLAGPTQTAMGAPLQSQPQLQPQANDGSFQIAAATPAANTAPRSTGVSEQTFTPAPFGTVAQNTVVTRDFVPQVQVTADQAAGAGGPNLFNFALSTRHNVGQPVYPRNHPMRWRRWEAACLQFANQDLAQEAFLAAGGPDRDPNHLDPDGDGFACWWDPAPFRQAATTVVRRQ
jgi:hypothetical protein